MVNNVVRIHKFIAIGIGLIVVLSMAMILRFRPPVRDLIPQSVDCIDDVARYDLKIPSFRMRK